jgi:hypothetical protein
MMLPIAEGLEPFKMAIPQVGFGHLFANALTAFMLNITSMRLIGASSALVLTLSGVFKVRIDYTGTSELILILLIHRIF